MVSFSSAVKLLLCRVVSKRFQSLTGQESLSFSLHNSSSSSTTTAPSSSTTTASSSHPQSSDASSSPSVTVADLDTLKHEILTEVRREISQAKQEIIEGLSGLFLCLRVVSHAR